MMKKLMKERNVDREISDCNNTWMLMWRLGKGKLGIKIPLSTKCIKIIYFSILMGEYWISNFQVTKKLLGPNGRAKTQFFQFSFFFSMLLDFSFFLFNAFGFSSILKSSDTATNALILESVVILEVIILLKHRK